MLQKLADVHRITCPLAGTEREVILFDHHRTAFTVWALAAQKVGPLTLLTLDRHMDLQTPKAAAPRFDETSTEALDAFARFALSPRNDDHILAALESGSITNAAIVARSHEPGPLARFKPFLDPRGATHAFAFAPRLERPKDDLLSLLEQATTLALDLDLDCFTTRSDGHLEEVLPWDKARIEDFLLAEGFPWARILPKVRVVTIAREPYHCGGFQRGAQLWMDFAKVFFEKLLGVPVP